jgi:hypothetical protein
VGTGVALANNSATTHTIKLTAHTLKGHNFNDTFVSAEKDTRHGNTIGFDVVDCVFNVSTHKASCNAQFALKAGSLFVHANVNEQNTGSGKVTGGTRHFKGATGTMTVSPGPTKNTTKIVITYTT